VHLAGAIGKATVVHLNGRKNWRWMYVGRNSSWYSSVEIQEKSTVDSKIKMHNNFTLPVKFDGIFSSDVDQSSS
jgi:hypothetical protein